MKMFLIILVLGLVAAGYFYYLKSPPGSWEEKVVSVDGRELSVKIADTREKREQGLRGVWTLGENEGMLFVFGEVKPVTIWNKDLGVDLDILWIKNFEVVAIASLPKADGSGTLTLDSPAGGVDMVIEAPALWVLTNAIRPGASVLGF